MSKQGNVQHYICVWYKNTTHLYTKSRVRALRACRLSTKLINLSLSVLRERFMEMSKNLFPEFL